MEVVDADRILSEMKSLPSLPAAVDAYLRGQPDVGEEEAVTALMAALSPRGPGTLGHGPWWAHALATAEGAMLIAERTGGCRDRQAFLAGLLHDVGQLVLVTLAPGAFREVLACEGMDVRFLDRERVRCGLDHVRAGVQLLRRWGLPEDVVDAVSRHHVASFEGDAPGSMTATLVLADTWAQVLGWGFDLPVGRGSLRTEEAASALDLLWGDQLRLVETLEPRILARARRHGVPVPCLDGAEDEAGRRVALWLSLHGSEPTPLGTLLLRHRGFGVVHVGSDDPLEPRDGDIVLIDSPWAEPEEVVDLVRMVVPGRTPCVALLSDPRPGEPMRRRDRASGICSIPRVFTVFDLRWLEACPVNPDPGHQAGAHRR